MNGIKYLADTNCFIYFLDAHPLLLPFSQDIWAYSYITEIELLSKPSLTSDQERIIRLLLSTCVKIDHTQTISDLTIDIRKKYKVKLPDSIIAATAQSLNIPLLTADKEFAKIKDFNCVILDL